ncbi:MAG: T9SS type A sorting domain-containing protein, partial [Bacteroidota bacterium]
YITILQWLCRTITGAHPYTDDLVAYFQLDEGSGTTSADASTSSLTATFNNGPLWKGSGAAIGDDLNFVEAASLGSSVVLAHPNGDQITVTVTSGTANTIYIYRVDSAPAVTSPPVTLDQLSTTNYFGVRAFGASGLDFEVSYDYDGHPGIVDENNLRLCSRASNSTNNWTLESTAVLDVSTNTLTLGGESRGEYILGSTATNPLPVELLYFTASLNEVEQVALSWSTVTEIDNEFFTIERSANGKDWSATVDLPGAGNSSEVLSYQAIDRSPLMGTSYYRLKQTDYDGQYSYSEVQVVERTANGSVGVSPTLGTGLFYLKNTQEDELKINVFDTTGALRKSWQITSGGTSTELDLQQLPPGWYYLQVNDEIFSIYKQ